MNVDSNLVINKTNIEGMRWFDPLKENVKFYGFNWIEEDKKYTRLPLKLKEKINEVSPKVGYLMNNTSGGQLHFRCNTKKLVIHAKVQNGAKLSGMTYVGQAGFDCYVGSNYDDLKFFDTARFDMTKFEQKHEEYEFTLFNNQPKEDKLIVINFPLYSNVVDLYFAIDNDAYVVKPDENLSVNDKIVYYGTSITQGGCASRPGLVYTNVLSRKMKCEFINFGFSGNAFGENLFAQIMATITDATMFVIDYEANAGTNGKMYDTLEPFILALREKNPTTPIIVISRIKYLFDDLNSTLGKNREKIRLFQKNMVKKLTNQGDKHLYYINGAKLLGEKYDEYTIDSIHPNDIGFSKLAESLEKEFKKIKRKERENE